MKKFTLSAAAVVVLAGMSCFTATTYAQNASTAPAPVKIGLIDMAEVFKDYKKFEALREDLKADIEATDAKAKAMATRAQSLQEKMKSGTYAQDSPEYKQLEKQLIQVQTEFQAFKAEMQREFMRKESQIYKTVYLEVSDAVKKYAEYYKFTLVLRYNRKPLEETENPQDVLQGMNKQVIYTQSDNDITDPIVDYLNRLYDRQAGGGGNPKK